MGNYSTSTANPTSSFSTKQLILLYRNARCRDVYINNFSGFKTLIEWLLDNSPAIMNTEDIAPPEFRELYRKNARLLGSFEVQELAVLLGTTQEDIVWTLLNS